MTIPDQFLSAEDLDLRNLTDQRNWIHNGDAYTSSILVLPELPLRAEAYVKYRF